MTFLGEIVVALIIAHVVLAIQIRNYQIQMDHLEVLESANRPSFNFSIWRVTKFNRTTYTVRGTFVELAKSTADVEVEFTSHLMTGNVYKQEPYKIPRQPVCQFWKTQYKSILYEGLRPYSNLPEPDECPWPKREFYLKDYVFDEKTTALPPYITLGKYRYDARSYENNKETGGFSFYLSLVKPGTA